MSDDHKQTDDRALLPFEEAGKWPIRTQWHNGQWFLSVVDVIRVLTDSSAPRQYWVDTKKRMQGEGYREVSENILQLKMRSLDGKMRATDAANVQTMLRIVQSVPSPKAEPVKLWLARVGAERLDDAVASRDEPERRILIRGEVTEKNVTLNNAAASVGVVSRRDFAIFHDYGYMGMYNGETASDIHARKGLAPAQHILDWMSSTELAANLFRITQTEEKLRRDPQITTKEKANQAHLNMGKAVRQFIVEQGGTPPEQLPTPGHSVQDLHRLEQQRIQRELQPSLFDETEQ